MKFTKIFLMGGVLILCLLACSKKEETLSLVEETRYAQRNPEFVFIDYLREGAPVRLEEGWTPLSQKGTRLGIFPQSRLDFTRKDQRPVYLSCRFKPVPEGIHSARELAIQMEGRSIARVRLKPHLSRYIQVPLPSESLQKGENTLHFVYNPGSHDKAIEKERKKRFSLVFSQLVISSFKDQRIIERCLKAHEMEKNRKDVLVQRIPGEIDYYLNLSPGSSFEADYRFLPLTSEPSHDLRVKWVFQKTGGTEQVIDQESIPRSSSEGSLDVRLKGAEGIGKLAIRVEGDTGTQALMVWGQPIIRQKGKGSPEKSISSQRLSSLRSSFQDKNTIIIVFDAARVDHFSTYGYFRPTTPHVTRFSQDSVVFTQAFSEALTTRCSIGTLFTGYPLAVTRVTGLFSKLPPELTTVAQLFRSKGFHTTGFTGMGNISSDFNFHRGFDEYVELFKEKGFHRKSQEYIPYVLPWLEKNKDKKFFLYIHFKEPHAVYKPVPDFQGLFSHSYEDKVDLEEYHKFLDRLTPDQMEYIRACYDENLASVDSVFGTLIEKIKNLGLWEKSIVVLIADHGEFLGEKDNLFGHGLHFGEPGIHIPLLIHFPGLSKEKSPSQVKAVVKMSDIFMTLADIYQFQIPEALMEGKSLLPLLVEPQREVNSRVILGKRGTPGHCFRTKRYKLVFWEKSDEVCFYDLKEDPKEQNDLYTQDSVQANYLLVELEKWLDRQQSIRKYLIHHKQEQKLEIDQRTLENLKTLGYIK